MGVAIPPAKYGKAQINEIVAAIDEIYPHTAAIERALTDSNSPVKCSIV